MMKSEPQARDQVLRGPSGVAVVVAFVPPMDLRGMTGSGTDSPALDFQADLASSVSPINFVSPGDPLTLLVHGDADKVVPISHSQRIHDALKIAGVMTEPMAMEGGTHGFAGNRDHLRRAND